MDCCTQVAGGMLSLGDCHTAQGDSEFDGTAIETSIDASLRLTVLKANRLPAPVQNLQFPLLENDNEYVVHGFTYPVSDFPSCQPQCTLVSVNRSHDLDRFWHCKLAAASKLFNIINMLHCASLHASDIRPCLFSRKYPCCKANEWILLKNRRAPFLTFLTY